MEKFLSGWVAGVATFILVANLAGRTPEDMRRQIHKEAFNRGYMEKKIDKDDEVIYVWRENNLK